MERDAVSDLDMDHQECDVTVAVETELVKAERSRQQAEQRESVPAPR